jgi:hypothetical protein
VAKSAAQRKREERKRLAQGQRIETVTVRANEHVVIVPETLLDILLRAGVLKEADLDDYAKVSRAMVNLVSRVTRAGSQS